jgi:hypothetical protein
VGNAIRLMCRSPKSRAGCHFGAAIGLGSLPEGELTISILARRKLGRGLDVRKEGGKLVPGPTGDDPYEDEAYRQWQIKQQGT